MYPTFKSDGLERGPAVDLAFLRARREIDEFLSYFGFRESPFGVTPDPGFLFFSRRHREALDAMIQAIESNLGFTVLLGEPGLGKTTLLFQLLAQYRDCARTAYIFLTRCKPNDLLRYLASELELPGLNRDEVAFHQRLNDLLVSEAQAGRKVLIILDEAQNLNHASLETIRLLSGFETPSSKLLHVILAGSGRLGETLLAAKQSPLAQRISTQCRLEPLNADEVREYIRFRLGIAGANDIRGLFPPDALDEVAIQSGGVPRMVNSICYHALWLAFSRGEHHLSAAAVREAARDLNLSTSTGMNFSRPQTAVVTQRAEEAEALTEPIENDPVEIKAMAEKPDLLSLLAESISEKEQPLEADQVGGELPLPPLVSPPEELSFPPTPADDFAESVKQRLYSPGPSAVSTSALKSRPWRRPGWLGDGTPAHVRVARLLRSKTAGVNTERALVSLAVLLLLGLGFWTGWRQLMAKPRPAAQHSTALQTNEAASHGKDAEARGGELQPQADGAERTVAAATLEPAAADPTPTVAKPHPTPFISTLPSGQASRIGPSLGRPAEPVSPTNLASLSRNSESIKIALNAVPTAVPHLDMPAASASTTTPANGTANLTPATSLRPTKMVQPEYPQKAKLWHVEGEVLLELTIDQDGNVQKVKPLNGNPLLIQAAENAAQQWHYPVSNEGSVTQVKFNFKLGADGRR